MPRTPSCRAVSLAVPLGGLLAALAFLPALAACAGPAADAAPEASATGEPAATRPDDPAPSATGPACRDAPAELLDLIGAATGDGAALEVGPGAAVLDATTRAYVVAARVTPAGGQPRVGVWLSDSLRLRDDPMVMAVDATADELTTFGSVHPGPGGGPDADPGATPTGRVDGLARRAVDCLG